jgi:hypothetical protein
MPQGPSQHGYLPGRDSAKTPACQGGITGTPVVLSGNVAYIGPACLITPSVVTGAAQLTAQQVMGGLIVHDREGAGATQLPDAADLVAAYNGCVVGSAIRFMIKNDADGVDLQTYTIGANMTIFDSPGNNNVDLLSVVQFQTSEFIIVFTNVEPTNETCTIYNIGNSLATAS